jgi:2'-5' RNA ligase
MRLFTAVDLDDAGRRAIGAEQRRLARGIDPDGRFLKWVDPNRLHVTLGFLGEVADADGARVVDLMTSDIDAAPFEIVFERLGVFPPRGVPRALWLGVSEGALALVDLERLVKERLRSLALQLEERPLSAHLTLARWRNARRSDRIRALSMDRQVMIARARVGHVTLYQSRLSSGGPTYTALARATLRSCPPLSS